MSRPAITLKRAALALSALVFALILQAAPAHADTLNFSLTSSTLSGASGDTLTFFGTVSTPSSNRKTIYLNGDSLNFSASGATVDDSGFVFNFPLSLDPNNTFTGELFTVTLPSDLPQGLYSGYFEILGGSNSSVSSTLATVGFQVVDGAAPEPTSWLLLATAVAFLGFAMRTQMASGSRRENSGPLSSPEC